MWVSSHEIPFHITNRVQVVIVSVIEMWVESTYSFPNFNGSAVEVWEWISNLIPHFTGNLIAYPCY